MVPDHKMRCPLLFCVSLRTLLFLPVCMLVLLMTFAALAVLFLVLSFV